MPSYEEQLYEEPWKTFHEYVAIKFPNTEEVTPEIFEQIVQPAKDLRQKAIYLLGKSDFDSRSSSGETLPLDAEFQAAFRRMGFLFNEYASRWIHELDNVNTFTARLENPRTGKPVYIAGQPWDLAPSFNDSWVRDAGLNRIDTLAFWTILALRVSIDLLEDSILSSAYIGLARQLLKAAKDEQELLTLQKNISHISGKKSKGIAKPSRSNLVRSQVKTALHAQKRQGNALKAILQTWRTSPPRGLGVQYINNCYIFENLDGLSWKASSSAIEKLFSEAKGG